MSSLGKAQCAVWERHSVLSGKDTLSSWERIQYASWNRHNVLLGKGTTSAVAMTHGLLWKDQVVLRDNDAILWFLRFYCGIIMKAFLLEGF